MNLKKKAKANAKNIEGKFQELAGNVTNNQELKHKGKSKQVEAEVRQKVDEVKDDTKKIID